MHAPLNDTSPGLSALSVEPIWTAAIDAAPAAQRSAPQLRIDATVASSADVVATGSNREGFLLQLRDVGREHALLLGVVGCYFALGHFAIPHVTMSGLVAPLDALRVVMVLGVTSLLVGLVLERWRLARNGGPDTFPAAWYQAYGNLHRRFLTVQALAGFFLGVVVYGMFMAAFGRYKAAIPELHPFAFDELFLHLDRVLHFGVDPWRLLHPILGYPVMTVIVDRLYFVWYFVGVGVLVWQLWSSNRALRTQFLLTLVGCWVVLGTFFATLFSSVGPCYFEALTGNAEPYEPLMQYLTEVSAQYGLYAVSLQNALWAAYEGRGGMPFVGIAAMPSLHVALAVLWTLLAWRVDRRLGAAFAAFAFLTMLGSVHLGWHYAIDGYFSIALVPLLWWGAGRLTAWYGGRTGAFR